MTLLDRLAALADAAPDTDLAAALGVGPGGLRVGRDGLTVGAETVSLDDCRRALAGGPRPAAGRIRIEDLCATRGPT